MANRPSLKDLSPAERASLAGRVREMVEEIGTHSAAAEVTHVSLRQLREYLAGRVAPPFLAVAKLAGATGRSLDWVATGEGSRMRPVPASPFVSELVQALPHNRHEARR
jgi:hypothetical protein